MECHEVQSQLVRYLDNDLSPQQHGAVEDHLEHCYLCTEELHETVSLLDTCRDALRCPETRNRFEELRPLLRRPASIGARPQSPLRPYQIVAGWAALAAVAILLISTAAPVVRTIRGLDLLVARSQNPPEIVFPEQKGPDTTNMPFLLAWQTRVNWAESLNENGRAVNNAPSAPDTDQDSTVPKPLSLQESDPPVSDRGLIGSKAKCHLVYETGGSPIVTARNDALGTPSPSSARVMWRADYGAIQI